MALCLLPDASFCSFRRISSILPPPGYSPSRGGRGEAARQRRRRRREEGGAGGGAEPGLGLSPPRQCLRGRGARRPAAAPLPPMNHAELHGGDTSVVAAAESLLLLSHRGQAPLAQGAGTGPALPAGAQGLPGGAGVGGGAERGRGGRRRSRSLRRQRRPRGRRAGGSPWRPAAGGRRQPRPVRPGQRGAGAGCASGPQLRPGAAERSPGRVPAAGALLRRRCRSAAPGRTQRARPASVPALRVPWKKWGQISGCELCAFLLKVTAVSVCAFTGTRTFMSPTCQPPGERPATPLAQTWNASYPPNLLPSSVCCCFPALSLVYMLVALFVTASLN